jgi:ubiquitin carboxyl-terminal hydrolase 8
MKNKPLLLKGGYSEWILTYPMFSSNPNVFVSGSKFNISQKQLPLDFNYEFNDDEKEQKNSNNHVVNGVVNGDIDKDLETNEVGLQSRLNNIFQPRPTNTAIPGTALPLIPDRTMKPKFQNEDIKSTNQKSIQLVNDFEKIKLIKQNEATEQMLSSLQEGVDQKMNSYEQQLKEKDEMIKKKDELIKKKEEENKAFRKFLPQKPISNEKNIPTINGDISNSDKRNGVYISNDEKGDQKSMNDISFKSHNMLNGENHTNNDDVLTTPKSSFKPSNLLSLNNSNLSRSLSSPNIAQLLAKEEDKENNLKVRSITNPPQPQFDRNLKPLKQTFHDNKIRDFSPVYSAVLTLTGLRNLGNTCFMNAVIQCLQSTDEFTQVLRENHKVNRGTKFGSNGELAIELSALLRAMEFPSTVKSIAPKDFKLAVSKHLPGFIGCNQQDSHEFLVMLLGKLHEDLNTANDKNIIDSTISEDMPLSVAANKFWKNHISRNESIITKLFEGLLVHTLTCLTCHKTSNSFEVISCLSLPLTNYRTTLNECFSQYFKPERMSGEAAWECPTCKVKREADKKVTIWKLPKILLVHLKRYFN